MGKLIGIYRITNIVNNKVYIGQSFDIMKRFTTHKYLSKLNNKNTHLYSSIKVHGLKNFEFHVLELCDKDYLNYLEKKYVNFYESNNSTFGYNLTSGGNQKYHFTDSVRLKISKSNLGKRHSDETKLKLSLVGKGRIPKNKGNHLSEDVKHKLRICNLGKKHSDETKLKMTASRIGKKLPYREGRIAWNKGSNLSEIQKLNISNSVINSITTESKIKHKEALSKYWSSEAGIIRKQKISERNKLRDSKQYIDSALKHWRSSDGMLRKANGYSDSHKKNISESLKGKLLSKEHRKKISISKYKPVYQYDIGNKIIAQFDSIGIASEKTQIDRNKISRCCNNKINSANNFIFKFTNQ